MHNIPRREFITKGSAAIAALATLYATQRAYAFPSQPGEEVVRWLDQPAPNPGPGGDQEAARLGGPRFLDHSQ